MLPIEFVVRRLGWGSYLLRHPDPIERSSGPRYFDDLVVERFHKHSMVLPPATAQPHLLEEGVARAQFLREGVWADGVYTDPYIEVGSDRWSLHPAKAPVRSGPECLVIDAQITPASQEIIVETLLQPAFECLEEAWRRIETVDGPVILADCKFEVGIRRSDGALVLGDVVDNDSWRIWPRGDPTKQLDKQCFRDGEPLSKVEDVYPLVTELTTQWAGTAPASPGMGQG